MDKEYPVYQLFVSSPGDVLAEQKLAENVVTEFNRTWSRFFAIHLEALRCETNLYPHLASDLQAGVNETIRDEFDLYVGLMWKRFGTPTPRAGSGTAEEYERAVARHRAQPESVQVAFYFRNITDADRLDAADEIGRIEAFRNKIGLSGTLWWPYRDPRDFEALFRIHLAYHVQRWLRARPSLLQKIGAEQAPQPRPEVEETESVEIGEVLHSMTAVITRLGEGLNEHQTTLTQSTDPDEVQGALDGSIQVLREYATGLDRTLPQFAQAFAAAFRGPGRAAIQGLGASADRGKDEKIALTVIIIYLQTMRVQLDEIVGHVLILANVLLKSTEALREMRAAPEPQGAAADALRASSMLLVEMVKADARLNQVSAMLEEIRGEDVSN